MTNSKTLKVFVGPYEIAGYYSNLVQGLQQINVDCDYITYSSNKFNYGGETKTPWLLKCSKSLSLVDSARNLAPSSVILLDFKFSVFKFSI